MPSSPQSQYAHAPAPEPFRGFVMRFVNLKLLTESRTIVPESLHGAFMENPGWVDHCSIDDLCRIDKNL